MAKIKKNLFYCSNPNCDYPPKTRWFGECPKCGSISEEREDTNSMVIKGKEISQNNNLYKSKSRKISDITTETAPRIKTGIEQVNTIFGKNSVNDSTGIALGSVNLLSGKPGVGKSTLLLSLIDFISNSGFKALYISGEESEEQIKDRHVRLELNSNVSVLSETNYEKILPDILEHEFIIIDSINTLFIEGNGIVGGVSQIKELTNNITRLSIDHNKTFLIIAQINGAGDIAGPQSLEHMVDAVFFFEDFDDSGTFKIITSQKNRFGKVNETAIFEMTSKGMKEIADPSMLFLEEDEESIGTARSMIFKGNRPILIEIESLVNETQSDKPIIASVGIDQKKVFQIIAILSKYLKFNAFNNNIFSNVVGGINLTKGKVQTQVDLAILASILSSEREININKYIFIGEITLSGKIRKAPQEHIIIEHIKTLMKDKIIISNSTNYKKIEDIIPIFQ